MQTSTRALIVSNVPLTQGICQMRLRSPELVKAARPGQFVEIRVSSGASTDPLLRRPMSIADASPARGVFTLVYQVKGRGTELLSRMHPGDELDVLGPLGSSFTLRSKVSRPILVGGGIGVAPLLFLARTMAGVGRMADCIVGFRNIDQAVLVDELRALCERVVICTEDGSSGYRGLVTDALRAYLDRGSSAEGGGVNPCGQSSVLRPGEGGGPSSYGPDDRLQREESERPSVHRFSGVLRSGDGRGLYACGPMSMLREVKRLASDAGLPLQVSLESRMACGVGACLGCAQKVVSAGGFVYRRVCADGPVFDGSEVVFD